jgi:hypothetical protein
MFVRRLLSIALMLVALPCAANAADKIPVYVRGEAAKDGWTDASGERADSARDLARHIGASGRKWIRRADTEADAAVVVEVIGRRREFRAFVLDVRVTAGDYTTEMSSSTDALAWRDCALKVAKKLDEWARDNRARLTAAR